MIYLAGIPVTERLVLELARRLRAAELHTTAGKLEHATAVEARPPTSVRNVEPARVGYIEEEPPPHP